MVLDKKIQPDNRPPMYFENADHLRQYLQSREIQLQIWGKGQYRTVERLWESFQTEQVCIIDQGKGFPPHLDVNVSVVYVQYYRPSDGELIEIFEEKRTLLDGTKVPRNFRGLAETLLLDENKRKGADRCLHEELGQTEPKFKKALPLRECPCEVLNGPSHKYFGLAARYNREIFRYEINASFYHKVYLEINRKSGIITEFGWRAQPPLIKRS